VKRTSKVNLALLVFSLLTLNASAQKKLAPLPIEDLLKIQSFTYTPLDISPNGEWAAYTLKTTGNINPLSTKSRYFTPNGIFRFSSMSGNMKVWITNTRTGESKDVSAGGNFNWSAAWSPDGEKLAFYSDADGQPNLWVWEKSTGQSRRVSNAVVRITNGDQVVNWNPDGTKVICRILPEGMTLEDSVKLGSSGAVLPRTKWLEEPFRNDNRPSSFVLSSPAKSTQTEKTNAANEINEPAFLNLYLADLAVIDVKTGGLRRIARNVRPMWYAFSPKGDQAAFVALKGYELNSQQALGDLMTTSSQDAQPRTLVSNIRSSNLPFSWSPDGEAISYLTAGPRSDGEAYIVPAGGGEPRRMSKNNHPRFSSVYPPLWDKNGQNAYFLAANALWTISAKSGEAREIVRIPDRTIRSIISPTARGRIQSPSGGQSVIVTTVDNDTKKNGFYAIDLVTGSFSTLREEDKAFGGSRNSAISDDGKTIIYLAQDARHTSEIWATDPQFNSPKQITDLMGAVGQYQMGESRLIEWRSTDGQQLRGALLLPAGYKEGMRYPLVVHVYGGAYGSDYVNNFGTEVDSTVSSFNHQVLATRGYAVLFPDAPLRVGTPMRDLANTVLPGVNKVIELGIAHPERLAVMGHSYGSFSTLALITQTPRFKAAIISAVVAPDMLTGYLHMDNSGGNTATGYYEEGQGGMGGTPWQYRDRYLENSTVFYFDKIQTPVLMSQGTDDYGFPLFFPDQVFNGLKRLGKEVEFVIYKGESHVLALNVNITDFWNRRLEWLDKHLNTPNSEKRTAALPR
jgi:dipeptidyl aminopeptidase/acylaminoacyl peptidase